MFSIGPFEVVIILIVALVIVGPEKLPDLARMVARALRDLKKYANDVRREFEQGDLTRDIKEDLSALTHDTTSGHYPYSDASDTAEEEPYRYEDEGRYEGYEEEGGYGAQEDETGEEDEGGASDTEKPLHDEYPPD